MKDNKHLTKVCSLQWLQDQVGNINEQGRMNLKEKPGMGPRANWRAQPPLKAFTIKLFSAFGEGGNKSKIQTKSKIETQTKHIQPCIWPVSTC